VWFAAPNEWLRSELRGASSRDEISKEREVIALIPFGRLAFVALAVSMRWMAAKLNGHANRAWVTGRTGNVTVITERIF